MKDYWAHVVLPRLTSDLTRNGARALIAKRLPSPVGDDGRISLLLLILAQRQHNLQTTPAVRALNEIVCVGIVLDEVMEDDVHAKVLADVELLDVRAELLYEGAMLEYLGQATFHLAAVLVAVDAELHAHERVLLGVEGEHVGKGAHRVGVGSGELHAAISDGGGHHFGFIELEVVVKASDANQVSHTMFG
eukprot:Stramenopile-MAST_4_protein_5760